MREFYIYQLKIEGHALPFYVGKGHGDRFNQHFTPSSLRKRTVKNRIIKEALKSGLAVVPEIIEAGLSESEAFGREIALIAKYGRLNSGTGILANMTDGGEGACGKVVSEDTRARLAEAMRGRVILEESKQKMRKPKSAQARQKMSEATKGKPRSALWHAAMAEGRRRRYENAGSPLKGRALDPEHRAKIAKANTGKKASPELREKLRLAAIAREAAKREKRYDRQD